MALRYFAPAPCPADENFVQHVHRRSTRLRLEPESLAVSLPEQVHVSVEPEASGEGWRGELRIVGTSSLVREVRGARCDDVVAALALITVLRLEPSEAALAGAAPGSAGLATSEVTPTPAAEPASEAQKPARATPEATVEAPTPAAEAAVEEPTPTAEATVKAPTPPSVAVEDVASTPSTAAETADDTADGARPEEDTRAEPLRLRTSLFGHAGYSSMPSHALKLALGAELRLGETAAAWSGGLLLALARGNDRSADGTSELTLLTAELRLCPPGIGLDAGFSLRACAQLSGGRLAVSLPPSRVLETTDRARPWVALGPSVDAGLPLSSRFSLGVRSALMFHLIRDTFERASSGDATDPAVRVPLYRPEAISIELLLGVGYTF